MQKYRSIESFRHVVKEVHRYYHNKGIVNFPTLTFKGTCKLHGTNAAVRITHSQIHPQSRERLLAIDNDNYGFALFVEGHKELLRNLYDLYGSEITLYGEWVGVGIQKGVGLSQLNKHWVLFNAFDHAQEKYVEIDTITDKLDENQIKNIYNENSIFFINQIPSYELKIDFNHPENSIDEITNITMEVEKNCPWTAFRGIPDQVGEGIVWKAETVSDLWFKSKGVLHKNDKEKKHKIAAYTPQFYATEELINELLPDWRLEQGISYLNENGIPLEKENTGKYLKWVGDDVTKECRDILVANNIEWKLIAGTVANVARKFYFNYIGEV